MLELNNPTVRVEVRFARYYRVLNLNPRSLNEQRNSS